MPSLPLPGYTRVYAPAGSGCVDVHERHGKQERAENLLIAAFLVDLGEHVYLLPVSQVHGFKSPDATRDGMPWEFKVPTGHTANAIDKALRDGSKQAARILRHLPADLAASLVEQALFDRVRRTLTIEEVAVLRGRQLVAYTRLEIVGNTFRGKLA